MNLPKKVIALTSVAASSLTAVTTAFAQVESISIDLSKGGFKIQDFGKLITGLLNMVMFVAALLVFAYLVWGGIQWITSGGDKGKTEEARNKITAAVIGLAVVAASYAIFLLVISFLGVDDPFKGNFAIPKAFE